MKKILLTLGTFSLGIIPVLTIISCGHNALVSATAIETQKEMIARQVDVQKALNTLSPADLTKPTKVIAVLKIAMPEAKYQKVISGIKKVTFTPKVDAEKPSLVIVLAPAAESPIVAVTILNLIPQKSVSALRNLLISISLKDTLKGKLEELTTTQLFDPVQIHSKIKLMLNDSSYTTEIDAIRTRFDPETKTLIITFSDATQMTILKIETVPEIKGAAELRAEMINKIDQIRANMGHLTERQIEVNNDFYYINSEIKVVIANDSFNEEINNITTNWDGIAKKLTINFGPLSEASPLIIPNLTNYIKNRLDVDNAFQKNEEKIRKQLETLTRYQLGNEPYLVRAMIKIVIRDHSYWPALNDIVAEFVDADNLKIYFGNTTRGEFIINDFKNYRKSTAELIAKIRTKKKEIRKQLEFLTSYKIIQRSYYQTAIRLVLNDPSYLTAINSLEIKYNSLFDGKITMFIEDQNIIFKDISFQKNISQLNEKMKEVSVSIHDVLIDLTTTQLSDSSQVKTAIKSIIKDHSYWKEINAMTSTWNVTDSQLLLIFGKKKISRSISLMGYRKNVEQLKIMIAKHLNEIRHELNNTLNLEDFGDSIPTLFKNNISDQSYWYEIDKMSFDSGYGGILAIVFSDNSNIYIENVLFKENSNTLIN